MHISASVLWAMILRGLRSLPWSSSPHTHEVIAGRVPPPSPPATMNAVQGGKVLGAVSAAGILAIIAANLPALVQWLGENPDTVKNLIGVKTGSIVLIVVSAAWSIYQQLKGNNPPQPAPGPVPQPDPGPLPVDPTPPTAGPLPPHDYGRYSPPPSPADPLPAHYGRSR